MENAEKNLKVERREMREAPIFSQIKRGRLKSDNFFIIFAMLGGILLPLIFYKRFETTKEQIIKSRKYSP